MPKFRTEQEIEAYLELETHPIPLPCGGERPMTAMKALWTSLDSILLMSQFTRQDLADFAQETVESKGYSYEDAFQAVVAFVHQEICRVNGYA